MAKQPKSTKGKFLKVICPRCKACKTIFGKATSKVKCDGCNYLLLMTGGGKSKIRAAIKEVLWS